MHPRLPKIISPDNFLKNKLSKITLKLHRSNHNQTRVFAFIDSQNINQGVINSGWKMNWQLFRQWLLEHYNVTEAYCFMGYMEEHKDLYQQLHSQKFNIDLKETIKSSDPTQTKGNVDINLTLGVLVNYSDYDQAIIVSGDGDFTPLIEYLLKSNKLKNVMVPEKYSVLLDNKFSKYLVHLNDYRGYLHYEKKSERLKREARIRPHLRRSASKLKGRVSSLRKRQSLKKTPFGK